MRGDTRYRIAYVIGELGKGGAEYQLHELLRHLDLDAFEPRVFVLAEGGCWIDPIRRLGVTVVEVGRRSSADVSRLTRLRAQLRQFAPHVLHTILWSGNCYGRLAAVGLGIPVVVAAERNAIRRPRWQVMIERMLDRVTDAYLVNCEAIAGLLVQEHGVLRSKIDVIPNGIDLARLPAFSLDRHTARVAAGLDPHRRLVAQIGRLAPQKDYPTFLRAAKMVAAELPDVDFLIVGEGNERAALETLTRRLGLEARVRFTGLRHDVPVLLAAVDVVALTSTFEGFPNVLLEAMAMGAVTVATDVGGCRELVQPQDTGLLVPPRAPAAVAAAITRVLRDHALAKRMVMAARRRVEATFAIETMARRTVGAYQGLLRASLASATVVAA